MIQTRIEYYESKDKLGRKDKWILRDWKANAEAWDNNQHNEIKLSGFEHFSGQRQNNCRCGARWLSEWEEDFSCPERRVVVGSKT